MRCIFCIFQLTKIRNKAQWQDNFQACEKTSSLVIQAPAPCTAGLTSAEAFLLSITTTHQRHHSLQMQPWLFLPSHYELTQNIKVSFPINGILLFSMFVFDMQVCARSTKLSLVGLDRVNAACLGLSVHLYNTERCLLGMSSHDSVLTKGQLPAATFTCSRLENRLQLYLITVKNSVQPLLFIGTTHNG